LYHGGTKRRREKGAENIFEEIMADNFPNQGKETDTHIQEVQIIPNRRNPKRPTPRHTINILKS